MDYKIEKMNGFTVIGFEKTVSAGRRENMSRLFSLIISESSACASAMMNVRSAT